MMPHFVRLGMSASRHLGVLRKDAVPYRQPVYFARIPSPMISRDVAYAFLREDCPVSIDYIEVS